eukprot:jgi/Ulvmu1/9602/UM054_0032.1
MATPEAAPAMDADGDARWDPQDEEFIEDVVMWGVASWTVGIAVLIAFLIYFMVRCICWICLNDECCDKRNKVRASPKFVKANNIVISLLLVICIAAAGWLLYAGTPIIDSLDDLTATMIEQVETFSNNATDVITQVRTSLPADADIDLSELDDAQTQLQDARETLIDVKADVRTATDSFHDLIIGIAVVAIVCAILGLLCVFVRNIIFLYLYFILGFFVIFFLWVLAGFGITGNRAFTETCDMMRLHVAGDRNPTVLEELHCNDLAGAKDQINAAVLSGNVAVMELNDQLASADDQIGSFNPNHEPLPPVCVPFVLDEESNKYVAANVTEPAPAPAPVLVAGAAGTAGCTALRNDTIMTAYADRVCQADLPPNPSPLANADFRTCILSDPSQPLTQDQYADALARAGSVADLGAVLPQVYDIADCGFIDAAFAVIIAEECDDLDANSYGLAAAAFIAAISLTLTTFYFCICIQNIRKQDAPQASQEELEKKQFVTN